MFAIVKNLLEQLNQTDREILVMRHFEQMGNVEVAAALDLDPSTTSSRYLRAISRLQSRLSEIPGFFDDDQ